MTQERQSSCGTMYGLGSQEWSSLTTEPKLRQSLYCDGPPVNRITVYWEGLYEYDQRRHIGAAESVISMTEFNNDLYALTSHGRLWSRSRYEEDKLRTWKVRGSTRYKAGHIAEVAGYLYIPQNDRLRMQTWYLIDEEDQSFADWGEANGVVAMTSDASRLYAANDNKLWRRSQPITKNLPWDLIGHTSGEVVAMGAIGGEPYDNPVSPAPFDSLKDGWLLAVRMRVTSGKIWIRDSRPFDTNWVELASFGEYKRQ